VHARRVRPEKSRRLAAGQRPDSRHRSGRQSHGGILDFRFSISDFGLRPAGFGFRMEERTAKAGRREESTDFTDFTESELPPKAFGASLLNPISGFRFRIADCGLRPPAGRAGISDLKFEILDFRFGIADFRATAGRTEILEFRPLSTDN